MNQNIGNVVTTDASLVTRLSHNAMRGIIGAKSLNDEEIINEWQNDEKLVNAASPDIIVFTYAPFTVIRNRISERQQAGRFEEKFWGFNSPYFLESYQERWHAMIQKLSDAAFTCLSIDTTKTTPTESIEKYDIIRQSKII
jgi:thymidylate kinase